MLSDLEIRRKMFHLISGIIIVGLIYYDIFNYITAAVLIVLLVIYGILVKKIRIPFVSVIFEYLERPKDFKTIPGKGSVFYLTGVFLVLVLFSKDIAMAGIIVMALGDAIAPIIGQYGLIEHPFNRKKYIEGSIGGGIIAFIGAMLFVSPLEAGVAAVAAMIVEGIDLKLRVNPLDDNIIMPLIAGSVIWLLRFLL